MLLKKIKVYLFPLILGFMLSCHSDYVSFDYQVVPRGILNADSTASFFVLRKTAFRKAVGAAKFPDGGQPEFLKRELTLYELDLMHGDLIKRYDFDDLAQEEVNLSVELRASDSGILCSLYPSTDWQFYLKYANTESRKNEISRLSKQYNDSTFLLIEDGLAVAKLNGSALETGRSQPYSITNIMKELEKVPLAALGLNIQLVDPKSKKGFINECIYLKNDSPLARRAIVEQVIAPCSKEEIRSILLKMEAHADDLTGLEKTEYETYSKSTYEQIKALL